MDKQLAARRLSAALGCKIAPEEIAFHNAEGMVQLEDGSVFHLAGGNSAYSAGGTWHRNGREWSIKPGEVVRFL